jgi:hypothetical protein
LTVSPTLWLVPAFGELEMTSPTATVLEFLRVIVPTVHFAALSRPPDAAVCVGERLHRRRRGVAGEVRHHALGRRRGGVGHRIPAGPTSEIVSGSLLLVSVPTSAWVAVKAIV